MNAPLEITAKSTGPTILAIQAGPKGSAGTGATSYTIPRADATHAGIISAAEWTVLAATSGANTGDQSLSLGTVGASTVDVNLSGGTSATVPAATASAAGVATAAQITKLDGIAPGAEVNVNADWNAVSGDAQILNKPTIPAAQVNSDWNAVSGLAQILNKPTLATVATTGAYADLSGKPTLGTAAALNVPAAGDAASGEVVKGSDTRLSDARTPTAHTHPLSDLTQSGATSGQIPSWNGSAWVPTAAPSGTTNLAQGTRTATTVPVTSSTGSSATLTAADASNAGVMIAADKVKLDAIIGTNTGDQTSIVGITGTKTQFNTAATDGDFLFVGDAPTAHNHTASDITDFNSAARAQVEAELIAGTNVTITPGGTGATRTLTIAASGGGSQILLYKAKTSATSGDPGDGYMLWNNASQVAATVLYIDHLTDSGIDIDPVLVAMKTGDEILVFDKDDSDNTQYWEITSTPTFFDHGAGSYLSVPVSLTSSTGTGTTGYANNHPLALVWRQAAGSGGGATNLSIANITTTTLDIASDTGTDATIPAATSSAAGLLTAADFGKVARVRSVILDMVYTTLPTLTGTHTTDGYTCTAGNIVGVAVQAGSVSNGIWTVNAGAWTRPTWADTDALLRPLTMVCKPNGSNNTGSEFKITNTSAITVGSTSITVSQPVGSGVAVAGEFSVNRSGSAAACSLALYGNGGTTPTLTVAKASGANGSTTITGAGSGTMNFVQQTIQFLQSNGVTTSLGGSNGAHIVNIGNAGTTVGTAANNSLIGATNSENGIAWGDNRITAGTASTVTAKQCSVLFDPSGAAIAAYTLTLPASTLIVDGQELLVHAGAFGVTTLTMTAGSGTSIRGAITTLATDGFARWKYNTATATWMRVG